MGEINGPFRKTETSESLSQETNFPPGETIPEPDNENNSYHKVDRLHIRMIDQKFGFLSKSELFSEN